MTWLTMIGDGHLWILAGISLWILHEDGSTVLLHLATAYFIEIVIYKVAKHYIPRLRPCDHLPGVKRLVAPPDEYSFPSGHTAAAFVMVHILGAYAPMFILPAIALAVGIGFSRLYLGVHYPTDIVAGAALGLLSGVAAGVVISF